MINSTNMHLKQSISKHFSPAYKDSNRDPWPTIFDYTFWAADQEIALHCINRWSVDSNRLVEVEYAIFEQKDRFWEKVLESGGNGTPIPDIADSLLGWQRGEIVAKYKRDLRGVRITGLSFGSEVEPGWEASILDYGEFIECEFNGRLDHRLGSMHFFMHSLRFVKFESCKFNRSWFQSCVFENVVFSSCDFTSCAFKPSNQIEFKKVLFLNCSFQDVDLSLIDISEVIFGEGCTFERLKLSSTDWQEFEVIGKDIIKQIKIWDETSWFERRTIRSVTFGAGRTHNKYPSGDRDRRRTRKYQESLLILRGLIGFYIYVQGTVAAAHHDSYIMTHYVRSWLQDEVEFLRKGYALLPRIWIARWVFGYGDRPFRPLMAWFIPDFNFFICVPFFGN